MYITYTLPNKKEVKLKELLYKDLRVFSLYGGTSTHSQIEFLESFILTKGLNILEKFFALIYLRLQCVGSDIIIGSNKGDIGISLEYIRSNIEGISNIETDVTIEDIQYTLDYPLHFNTGNDDFILSLIKRIKIGEEELIIGDLTEEEYEQVVDRLPKQLYNYINSFLDDKGSFFNLVLLEQRDNVEVDPIGFNIIQTGFPKFIVSMFNCISDTGYREMLFALSKRINDVSFLINSTYLEVHDYFELYKEEIEAERSAG